eukprot:NODE_6224_length_1692_cov_3.556550.p1 GENE.NODE_6224_length_1692_cov_3.556550~~NODE_6224_length_1692_cov_3.556550.p1  ORF type:complete len:453 (+),score=110.58 NODE_6224_length_1692_cov_3.556550:119-1360(+)
MAAASARVRSRSRSPPRGSATRQDGRGVGRVRWYSGRRQTGIVDADDGHELLVPVGGAANRNFVPSTPGGLIHGTRVSFTDVAQSDGNGALARACVDVRPVENLQQPGLTCGVETRIGGRVANEDRLVANDIYDLGFLAGIFDGHGGTNCVDYVSQRLPQALYECYGERARRTGLLTPALEEELIRASLDEAFAVVDAEFLREARVQEVRDGTTAVVALLAHGFEASSSSSSSVPGCSGGVAKLFVANCGDSRAILVRGRKALPLSEDHKPERRDETLRIQKAGGLVIQDLATGIHRVGKKRGEHRLFLSTSRAFGNKELKEPQPLVISEPEVVVHTLAPEDWAVVLGCDGVWNTMSDQDVANTVWHVISFQGLGPVEAANEVANRAQGLGSTDNVTVVVMRLGWATPPKRMM